MKIGIMADSHDNLPMIRRAVEQFRAKQVECLIHAGDFVAPFAVREVLKFDGPVYGCFGNNDGERGGIAGLCAEIADAPRVLSLGGRNILLAHDDAQVEAARLGRADIVVTGHTHKAVVERESNTAGERLRVNPGECGGWLFGRPTVALLDTETLEARILEL